VHEVEEIARQDQGADPRLVACPKVVDEPGERLIGGEERGPTTRADVEVRHHHDAF